MCDFEKEKTDIRFKMAMKNHKDAKRDLMKIKMTKYENLDEVDKVFVDYNLALYFSEEGNTSLSNVYLSDIESIFNKDELLKGEMAIEYCDFLWLKTYENQKTMSEEEVVSNVTYVYEYYKSIEEYGKAIGSIANIYLLRGHRQKILESLEELLTCDINNEMFIEDILESCSNISYSLYIEALNLICEHTNFQNVI